jgi:CHAT domain-containing protein/Tfp pilus assembly protein PilF
MTPRRIKLLALLLFLVTLTIISAGRTLAAPPLQTEPATVLFAQAFEKLQAGEYAEAILLLRQLLEEYPNSEWVDDAQISLAFSHLYQKEYEQSASEARKLVTNYPESTWIENAYFILGESYFYLDEYKLAATWSEKLLAEYPSTNWAEISLTTLMFSYLYLDLSDQAVRTAHTLLEEYPNSENATQAAWVIQNFETSVPLAFPSQATGEVKPLYDRAMEFFNAEAYTKAIPLFQEIVDEYPENEWADEALFALAMSYHYLDEVEQFQIAYQRLLDAYPQSEYADIEKVLSHMLSDALSDESDDGLVGNMSSTASGECDAMAEEGTALYQQSHYADALEQYQAALVCFHEVGDLPGESTVYNNIGTLYVKQRQYADALAHYEKSLTGARELDDRSREGAILNNIGGVYLDQGRYDDALAAFQEALAIRREIDDQQGEQETLNNLGGAYQGQGRYTQALEVYQEALTIQRRIGDRIGEGTTLANIAGIYDSQGRYSDALEMYRWALNIQQELDTWDGKLTVLVNIGGVYLSQGRYTDALELYEEALITARRAGDRYREAVILENIATLYSSQGRYAEALTLYQETLVIQEEIGDRIGVGRTFTNMGVTYRAQGRYGDALEAYEHASVIQSEMGDRSTQASTLNNIGFVYQAQGRYPEALESYQESLVILHELGDPVREAATLMNAAAILQEGANDDEALKVYELALSLLEQTDDRSREASLLNNLGTLYRRQGHYDEALEMYERSLALLRELGSQAREAVTLSNIGMVYSSQGNYEKALDFHQRARAMLQQVGEQASEAMILESIGSVYYAKGDHSRALEAFQQAIDIIEPVRASAGSAQGRTSFMDQHIETYYLSVDAAHRLGQDEQAFFVSERSRARAFLDSLATGQVQLSDKTAVDLLAHDQETFRRRQAAQEALAKARLLHPPDASLVADLETQLAEAEATYEQAQAAIEAHGSQLAALVPGRSTDQTVLSVSELQDLLGDQTTLISYFVLGDVTLAFLITHDSFQTIALDIGQQALAHQITILRDFADKTEPLPASAITLHDWLIEPLKEYLDTSHLAIIPNGVLHYLPFAALTDGESYLIEDYTLTILPSASALPFIQENADHTEGGLLILGNPAAGASELPPLAFAEREVQAVAELYGAQPLIGEAATEGAVWEQASQAKILHLAAHGNYNRANSLYSTVALAPSGNDENNNGRLEVWEVYGLDLSNADLVVLSACETQLGELSAGDEVVGLTRAFIFAGAPSVVASLWTVDDEATALLMERFYTHLRHGMGKAEALRQAQLETMAVEGYANPYYWAAFTLVGDGGEIGVVEQYMEEAELAEAPNRTWLWVVGAVLLLVVAGGGVWVWSRHK